MPQTFLHPNETHNFFSLTMEGDMDTVSISLRLFAGEN